MTTDASCKIQLSAWSELSKKEQTVFPHFSLTEHNLKAEATLNYSEEFPFRGKYHLPYIPPNPIENTSSSIYKEDPAASLLHRKYNWTRKVESLAKRTRKYNLLYSSFSNAVESRSKDIVMPHYAARFLKLVTQDPDSHFTGGTNWYYTGGRMDTLEVGKQHILLTTSGSRNQNLCSIPLMLLPEKGWAPNISESVTVTLPGNEVIYQLIGKNVKNVCLISTRQKNTCTIYTLEPKKRRFNLQGNHQATSETPFTSVDISLDNVGHYCTSSTNRQISLWDATSCKCTSSNIVKRPKHDLSNAWCSIQFLDCHMLLMADSCSLSYLDTRIDLKKPSLIFYPKDQCSLLSSCENISHTFQSSCFPSNFYVVTSHHLLELDIRTLNTSQRWTHMMRSPPLYGQALATHNSELICLANQEPAEVEVINNNLNNSNCDTLQSSTFPYLLPSLRETLHFGHMHGQLLDPRVQKRLKASITGLMCLQIKEGFPVQILTQTSHGDVFIQELECNKGIQSFYGKDNIDCFNKWENEVLVENVQSTLQITGRKQFSKSYYILSDPKCKINYDREGSLQKSLITSKCELLEYMDVLAPDLLAAWDVDNMSGWENEDDEETDESNLSAEDAVMRLDQYPVIQLNDTVHSHEAVTPLQNANTVIYPPFERTANKNEIFKTLEQVESSQKSPDLLQTIDSSGPGLKPNPRRSVAITITPRRKSNVSGF